MEKVLSVEDRIRKAEEIYYRRNAPVEKNVYIENKENTFKQKILKKITIQTLASACIFTGLFMILNNNTYSEITKNKVKEILSYNIDFNNLYKTVVVQNIMKEKDKEKENIVGTGEEATLSTEQNIIEAETTEQNLVEEASSLNQMEEDAEYVKQNISLINPIIGTITSKYGIRENVEPLYHTGIDIAANTGTVITSAMEGTAEVVSEEGSYGKHIKITNGEVSTLYAHCNNLYIKQGDYIKQGQQIAEVGSTGNATGPHLHFEIIRCERFIDPELILVF